MKDPETITVHFQWDRRNDHIEDRCESKAYKPTIDKRYRTTESVILRKADYEQLLEMAREPLEKRIAELEASLRGIRYMEGSAGITDYEFAQRALKIANAALNPNQET